MKRFPKFPIALLLLALLPSAWASESLDVVITGVDDPAKVNVEDALQHFQGTLLSPLDRAAVFDFYHHAPKVILNALEPYGYFHPAIQSNISQVNHHWTASFHITPGTEIHVSEVNIQIIGEGALDPKFLKFKEQLTLKAGEPLNIHLYNRMKQALFNIAQQRGYFEASMKQSNIVINFYNNQAKIIIVFNTGPRYLFGPTSFSDSPFALGFLHRFLYYKPGQYYDWDEIQKTQQGFVQSNYFNQVIITPEPDQAHNHIVPVQIHLINRNPAQYTLGMGYGTDTGPRGTVEASFRRLNAYGHRLNFMLQAAQINNIFTANYEIPGRHPGRDTFLIGGGFGRLRWKSGNSNAGRASLSYTTSFGDIKQIASLTYLRENYTLYQFPIPNLNAQLLYPSITWQYINTDKPLEPNYGINASIQIAGTPSELSANHNGFLQENASVSGLVTLQATHTRFLARAQVGRTDINSLQNLPLSLQLLAGGARSIRGFSYNSIGPGHNLFVGSFEIQQKIKGDFYLAGFYDAGNVTDSNVPSHLRQGVGPGIVWLSPLGALELDIAWAISEPHTPWRLQFNMGPVL